MRTFVALDLDPAVRQRILGFVQEVRSFAPSSRWMSGESLHVTLKFIGEQPEVTVSRIEASLKSVHSEPFQLRFSGTGFFPTPRDARVFWIGIQAEALSHLAKVIDEALAKSGIAEEDRAFSSHLTLARTRGGSGAPEGIRETNRTVNSLNCKSFWLHILRRILVP